MEEQKLVAAEHYIVSRKGAPVLSCLAIEDALYVLRVYRMGSVTRASDGKLLAFQAKSGIDVKAILKLGNL